MLKICIFHEPVISCDDLKRLASCLTSNVFTQFYFLLVLPLNRSRKISYFPKIGTCFFILIGCLQPCSLVNVLMVL